METLDELPESHLRCAISDLVDQGEPDTVLTYLRLNYSMPSQPSLDFAPGERVANRYTIVERIGAGGMGVVYRAKQDKTNRDVALKILHPQLHTEALVQRFEEEIATLGKLDHPGIVPVFDAGIHESAELRRQVVFFTMRLVDGQSLSAYLRKTTPSRHSRLELLIKVCGAVQAAHDSGVVHRDLKPGNILIDPNGNPVVLDFGLAALTDEVLSNHDRPISGLSGTPDYMSPEQFAPPAGLASATTSMDIYALGVIAYQTLSGALPYAFGKDASWTEKRSIVLHNAPQTLKGEPELDDVVRKALRKSPRDRYFSASGLARALTRTQEALATPEDRRVRTWEPEAGATVPSTTWILEERIGTGGIGDVWRASHPLHSDQRVFKFCVDEEKVGSLKRETGLFRILTDAIGHHEQIVRIHDVSLDDPPYYIAMDYIAGRDLASWTAEQGGISVLPKETRLDIVAQAAETLQSAHDAGILHRDIKPENLLIEQNGDQTRVYLADFGIGQLVGTSTDNRTRLGFTKSGETLLADPLGGSQNYVAPEILRGEPATVRSDIYSLGVVLYQSLVEDFSQPVTVDWNESIRDALLEEDLQACFRSEPKERLTSAGELASRLRALPERRKKADLLEKEAAAREKAAYRKGIVRAGAVATAIIAVIGILAGVALLQSRRARDEAAQRSLGQAESIIRFDRLAGRTDRGMQALSTAAEAIGEPVALRSAAAGVLALSDLKVTQGSAKTSLDGDAAKHESEEESVVATLGQLTAIGSSKDGVNGSITLINDTTQSRQEVQRATFPWIPIPEPKLLQFSKSGRYLAIAGPETSMHVLIFDLSADPVLKCYIYAGDSTSALAWHPGERLLVSGHRDGMLRFWDTDAGITPDLAKWSEDRALPPALTQAALDTPAAEIRWLGSEITATAFSPDGTVLSTCDSSARIGLWSGCGRFSSSPAEAPAPTVHLEGQLSTPATDLDWESDSSMQAQHVHAPVSMIRIKPSSFFKETWISTDLAAVAWNGDASQIGVLRSDRVEWRNAEDLSLLAKEELFSRGLAWHQNQWVITEDTSVGWWTLVQDGERWRPVKEPDSWTLSTKKENQGALLDVASEADALAIYHGRTLRILNKKTTRETTPVHQISSDAGRFERVFSLGSDRAGILTRSNRELWLEVFGTDGSHLGPIGTECDAVAGGGQTVIGRGTQAGIVRIDPHTGESMILDESKEARQRGPVALSRDGNWIAAIVDSSILRIISASDGSHVANLTPPRQRQILALNWGPNGNKILCVSEDGHLQRWDLRPWQAWLETKDLKFN